MGHKGGGHRRDPHGGTCQRRDHLGRRPGGCSHQAVLIGTSTKTVPSEVVPTSSITLALSSEIKSLLPSILTKGYLCERLATRV